MNLVWSGDEMEKLLQMWIPCRKESCMRFLLERATEYSSCRIDSAIRLRSWAIGTHWVYDHQSQDYKSLIQILFIPCIPFMRHVLSFLCSTLKPMSRCAAPIAWCELFPSWVRNKVKRWEMSRKKANKVYPSLSFMIMRRDPIWKTSSRTM